MLISSLLIASLATVISSKIVKRSAFDCEIGDQWTDEHIRFECVLDGAVKEARAVGCVPNKTASPLVMIQPGETFDGEHFTYSCAKNEDKVSYEIINCIIPGPTNLAIGESKTCDKSGAVWKCFRDEEGVVTLTQEMTTVIIDDSHGYEVEDKEQPASEEPKTLSRVKRAYGKNCGPKTTTRRTTRRPTTTRWVYIPPATTKSTPKPAPPTTKTTPKQPPTTTKTTPKPTPTTSKTTPKPAPTTTKTTSKPTQSTTKTTPKPTLTTTKTSPKPTPTTTKTTPKPVPTTTKSVTTTTKTTTKPAPVTTKPVPTTTKPVPSTSKAITTTKPPSQSPSTKPPVTMPPPTSTPSVTTTKPLPVTLPGSSSTSTTRSPVTTTTTPPPQRPVNTSTVPFTTTTITGKPCASTKTGSPVTDRPSTGSPGACTDHFDMCSSLAPICHSHHNSSVSNLKEIVKTMNITEKQIREILELAGGEELKTSSEEEKEELDEVIRGLGGFGSDEEEDCGCKEDACANRCQRRRRSSCKRCQIFKRKVRELVIMVCPSTCGSCGAVDKVPAIIKALVRFYTRDCR